MRRRHIAYAAAAALVAAVTLGCSADMGDPQKDEASGTGSISLSISDPAGSRTILPSGVTGPAPSAYLVGGTGPDGEDLTRGKATAAGSELATVSWKDPFGGDAVRQWFVTDKTALDVKGVHQGEWDLRVVSMYDALGEDGTFAEGASRIAKGQAVKRLSAAGASATVTLDRLVRGDEGGTLPAGQTAALTAKWDSDQVSTPTLTIKAKYQGDGTADSVAAGFTTWKEEALTAATNIGSYAYTSDPLPAGSYTVLASLTEGGKTIAGTADVVRIMENRQSIGDIPLTVGLVTNEYKLAIQDMTMRPIEGEIVVSGSSAAWYPDEGSFDALASAGLITVPDGKTYGTMTKDEIDQVLDASGLTYLWTIDGQQVEAAGNNVLWSGVATGEAALQVVVGSGLLGSLGSTGVTITAPAVESKTTVYTFTTDENGMGMITLKKPFSSTSEYEYVVDGEVLSHEYGTIVPAGASNSLGFPWDEAFNKDESKQLSVVFGEEFTDSSGETKANEYAVSFRLVSWSDDSPDDGSPISGAVVTVTETLDVITGMTTTVSADKTTQTWTGTPFLSESLYGALLPISIKYSPLSTIHIVSAEAGVDDTATAMRWYPQSIPVFGDNRYWKIKIRPMLNSDGSFSESEKSLNLDVYPPALGYKEFTMTMTTPAWTQEVAAKLTGGKPQEFALEKTVGSATRICGPSGYYRDNEFTFLTPSASSTVSGVYEATFVPSASYKDETVKVYLNAGLSGGNIVYKDKSMVMVPTWSGTSSSGVSPTSCTVYLGQ